MARRTKENTRDKRTKAETISNLPTIDLSPGIEELGQRALENPNGVDAKRIVVLQRILTLCERLARLDTIK